MNITATPLSAFADSKKHYTILDALRGVAALMVVAFHIFEAHTTSNQDQIINHGYLAVDFFYLLSGFVIGFAYDDRWGKMTLKGFFKRRLIRLHPMVVMGMVIGAIFFYFQGGSLFPGINQVPVGRMLLIMLIGCTLLPVPVSMDLRGWHEMHPLNGPGWSLFFEYVVNILYALFIRKFSNTLLAVLVFISGCALIHLAVAGPNGDVIGGWSLEPAQIRIGLTRVMFPFFGGLLLSRLTKTTQIKNAFLWCSILLMIALSVPRIGGTDHLWMNGIYVSFCIIVLFPLIVYMGACGEITGDKTSRIAKFLGDISFPIYITHYPLIYTYTAYVVDNKMPLSKSFPMAILVYVSSILIAYACLKWYDEPVRKWLSKRFINR